MRLHRLIAGAVLVLGLTACAGAQVQPALSTFPDLPSPPEGMEYVADRSGVMDGPSLKVARLVYRGRLEVESVSASMRTGLEQNGWKHIRTLTTANRTITSVFEKPGSDLQVSLWEGTWYTYLDLSLGRVQVSTASKSK